MFALPDMPRGHVITDMATGEQLIIRDDEDLADAIQGHAAPQSNEFLEAVLRDNPDAVAAPSGLVYEIKVPGEGRRPVTETDILVMDWEMVSRTGQGAINLDGSPVGKMRREMTLGEMMPGMAEGVKLIGVGGQILLFIPRHLIYKPEQADMPQVAGEVIFLVDLVDIVSR